MYLKVNKTVDIKSFHQKKKIFVTMYDNGC